MPLPIPARLFLALGSGFALALAFPAFDLPLTGWFSLSILLIACHHARPRAAFLLGLLHGLAFYFSTLPWIYTVMRVHGHLDRVPAFGVLVLMVIVLALFPAVFCLAFSFLSRRNLTHALIAIPFLWVALEFGRTHMLEIGFPWLLLGYAASPSLALLQLSPFAGIYGLSFLVAAFNTLLAWPLLTASPDRSRALYAVLGISPLLLLIVFLGPRFVPAPQRTHSARLVQSNIPQDPVSHAALFQSGNTVMAELELMTIAPPLAPFSSSPPDIIIWPEVPASFSMRDTRFANYATNIVGASGTPFLLGVVAWRPNPSNPARLAAYNSAVLLTPEGRQMFDYDKIHLVAFGEFIPWRDTLKFAASLTSEVGGFQKGTRIAVGELPLARATNPSVPHSFGVFICFEAVFPDLVRRFTKNGANLLINISNDGWFGGSAAPLQHLEMARVRAAENRRWLLRATNTGHTVAVDPYGRIVERLAPDTRAALTVPFAFRSDLTPYVRFGDWLPWLCVLVALLVLLWPFRDPLFRKRAELKPPAISRRAA